MTIGDQQTASQLSNDRDPRLSDSVPPLPGSEPKRAKRDRRPRTAGLKVGNPEVVGLEHGWERGAGSLPGPATRWRPKAGNGGQGERGAAGPRKKAIWTWGPGIRPELFLLPVAPQAPGPTPCSNLHQPSHQAQEVMPTPESHV